MKQPLLIVDLSKGWSDSARIAAAAARKAGKGPVDGTENLHEGGDAEISSHSEVKSQMKELGIVREKNGSYSVSAESEDGDETLNFKIQKDGKAKLVSASGGDGSVLGPGFNSGLKMPVSEVLGLIGEFRKFGE